MQAAVAQVFDLVVHVNATPIKRIKTLIFYIYIHVVLLWIFYQMKSIYMIEPEVVAQVLNHPHNA